jgi:hypothetical protein
MEIQYPKYFRVKATTVIPYTCGLTFVHVKKYQQLPRVLTLKGVNVTS